MYKIISLDGGGIRGLVTLAMLKRLEAGHPGLLEKTNLFAGTSTGGIIALGLAAGKTVDELISLYKDNGGKIFDDSWLDNIRDAGGLAGADYDQKNLGKLLRANFGDMCLKDLRKRVLIPTFDLDNEHPDNARRMWKPKFFHNYPGKGSDGEERVVDVALATSAAPLYFPSHNGFVDGGVVANNPSMAAIAQTQDKRSTENIPPFNSLCVLSLGTGINLSYIKGKTHDWGVVKWAVPITTILLDASSGIADFECRQLLRGKYLRIAPVFPPNINIKLDAWKRSNDLLKFGDSAPLIDSWTETDALGWLAKSKW